jgi:hypothetical protein
MAERVEARTTPLGSTPRITSFAEFWPYYLAAHKRPLNRALHYVGTTCAMGGVALSVLTRNAAWLLAVPVVGYLPAWIGHFFVEHNRPATFGYARFSLMADFKMLGHALRGQLGAEMKRIFGS